MDRRKLIAEEYVEPVRVNRLALMAMAVMATVIGLAPAVLALGRPQLLILVGLGSVLVAAVNSLMLDASAAKRPSIGEWMLGGLGAVAPVASLGILWLVAYGVLYSLAALAGLLAARLGIRIEPNADLIAFYPTVSLAAVLGGFFVRVGQRNMVAQLYPRTAGIRSAFHGLLTERRGALTGRALTALSVVGVVIAMGFLISGVPSTWFYVGLQVYLLAISSPPFSLSAEATPPREETRIVDAIGKLLESAGYDVEMYPRADDARVDPLLVDVDILAREGNHNLFVQIKTASRVKERIDWKTASALRQAAWILSETRDLSPQEADARLILVDVQGDKTLRKQEHVKTIELSQHDLDGVLAGEVSTEGRREAARALLGLGIDESVSS